MDASIGRSPPADERIRAGVEDERHPLGLPRRDDGLHGGHGLGEGLEPVLDIRADDTDSDRTADRLAGVVVPGVEVGGDRQVADGIDDATDHVEHDVERDLPVGISEGRGDGVAGGRDGARLGQRGDRLRRDGVPDVRDAEDLGRGVQSCKGAGSVDLSGHDFTLPAEPGP